MVKRIQISRAMLVRLKETNKPKRARTYYLNYLIGNLANLGRKLHYHGVKNSDQMELSGR